jgi:hypothetical protein
LDAASLPLGLIGGIERLREEAESLRLKSKPFVSKPSSKRSPKVIAPFPTTNDLAMSAPRFASDRQSLRESGITSKEPMAEEEGLTLKALAKFINLNYTRLSTTKNKMSETDFLDYLFQKSGLTWRYDATGRGKFFVVRASPY